MRRDFDWLTIPWFISTASRIPRRRYFRVLELERISPRIWYNSLETDLCGSRPAALHRPPVFYFGFQVSFPRGPEIRNGGMHGRVYEIGRVEIEEARFPLSVTYSRLLACSARLRFNEWNDDGNRSLSPHQSQLRNIRPD